MLFEKDCKKLYEMVCLYDQVGEVKRDEVEKLNSIMTLGENHEWSAIDILFNEEDYDDADDVMDYYFGTSMIELNKLADEFGYTRIGE